LKDSESFNAAFPNYDASYDHKIGFLGKLETGPRDGANLEPLLSSVNTGRGLAYTEFKAWEGESGC
jgi:hypothetical protein